MRVAIAVVMLAALGGSGVAAATEIEEIGQPPAAWAHMPADVIDGRQSAAGRAELARRHADALSRRQAELKAFHGGCPVDAAAAQGGLDPNAVGRRYGALILLLTPPAAFLGLLSLQHRRHRRQASR